MGSTRMRARALWAALAFAPCALIAQESAGADLFAALDRDGDGFLSGEELAATVPPGAGWIAIDRDGDQRFSRREFQPVSPDSRAPRQAAANDTLRGGYSARRMIGVPARDAEGRPLGAVREVLVNAGGAVTGLLVDDWRVPWRGVTIGPGAAHVTVPEPAASAGATHEPTAPWSGEWRASDFFGGSARLEGGDRYGRVEDLIITPSGEVRALVVDPGDGRRYAYPWRRGGAARLQPFDYGPLDIMPPR